MWRPCPHDGPAVLITEPQGAPVPHAREVAAETLATRTWLSPDGTGWCPDLGLPASSVRKKISVVYKLLILRCFCYFSPSQRQKVLPGSGGAAVTSKNVDVALLRGGGPRLGPVCAGQNRSASPERVWGVLRRQEASSGEARPQRTEATKPRAGGRGSGGEGVSGASERRVLGVRLGGPR